VRCVTGTSPENPLEVPVARLSGVCRSCLRPGFRDPVRVPDHNACYTRIARHPRATARAFTSLFGDHTRCKSFPSAVLFQLPGPSLVADSRRRLLVRSLLLEARPEDATPVDLRASRRRGWTNSRLRESATRLDPGNWKRTAVGKLLQRVGSQRSEVKTRAPLVGAKRFRGNKRCDLGPEPDL